MDVRTEAVQAWHVDAAVATMRDADREEVLASGGYDPRGAIEGARCFSVLDRVLLIEGRVAGIFGVLMLADGIAIPWALTTTLVDEFPRAYWRASKYILAELDKLFPAMEQQVDARYTRALVWLRHLGFTIHPAAPFGAAGLLFHRVTRGV